MRRFYFPLFFLTLVLSVEMVSRSLVPLTSFDSLWIADKNRGWKYAPGYRGYVTWTGRKALYQINSLGLRGGEIGPKTVERKRILVLGDSVTDGHGIALEETYPQVLETLLNREKAFPSFEIINAAVADYTLEQEVIQLKELLPLIQPDRVVIGFFLNDVRPFNRKALSPFAGLRNILFREYATYRLLVKGYRSSLVRASANKGTSPQPGRFYWVKQWEDKRWLTEGEATDDLIETNRSDWGNAWDPIPWQRVEELLDEVLALSSRHHFQVFLVCFPADVQVYGKEGGRYELSWPQSVLKAYAEKHRIPFVDLLPVFIAHKEKDIFSDWCHLTPLGHELAAKAIFEKVGFYRRQ